MIVLSGVLTAVTLVLLVLAGVGESMGYVYAAIATALVGAALVALWTYQHRGELAADEEVEPRSADGGVLVSVRTSPAQHAAGEAPSAAVLQAPAERPSAVMLPDGGTSQLRRHASGASTGSPARRAGQDRSPAEDPAGQTGQALDDQVLEDELVVDEALGDEAQGDEELADEELAKNEFADGELEDEALRDEALQDEALQDEALQDEALQDEALQDELQDDELQDEALRTGGGAPVLPDAGDDAPVPQPIDDPSPGQQDASSSGDVVGGRQSADRTGWAAQDVASADRSAGQALSEWNDSPGSERAEAPPVAARQPVGDQSEQVQGSAPSHTSARVGDPAGAAHPVTPEPVDQAVVPLTSVPWRPASVRGQVEVEGERGVRIVAGSRRYHAPSCRYLVGKTSDGLPREQAVLEGFAPCAVCQPQTTEETSQTPSPGKVPAAAEPANPPAAPRARQLSRPPSTATTSELTGEPTSEPTSEPMSRQPTDRPEDQPMPATPPAQESAPPAVPATPAPAPTDADDDAKRSSSLPSQPGREASQDGPGVFEPLELPDPSGLATAPPPSFGALPSPAESSTGDAAGATAQRAPGDAEAPAGPAGKRTRKPKSSTTTRPNAEAEVETRATAKGRAQPKPGPKPGPKPEPKREAKPEPEPLPTRSMVRRVTAANTPVPQRPAAPVVLRAPQFAKAPQRRPVRAPGAPAPAAPAQEASKPAAKASRKAAAKAPGKAPTAAVPATATASGAKAPGRTGATAQKSVPAKAPIAARTSTARRAGSARLQQPAGPSRSATSPDGGRTAAASSAAARGSVVVVPDRTKYHDEHCRFVRDVPGSQVLTRKAATGRGYAPCGVCKP